MRRKVNADRRSIFLGAPIFFDKIKTKNWEIPPMSVGWHVIGNDYFG